MQHYFAVIKLSPTSTPMKAAFIASDVNDALKEMCRVVRCTTTTEIAEYDLLEVLGDNKYREVASKIGNEFRQPKVMLPPPLGEDIDDTETVYVPYMLETHEDKL